MRITVGRGGGGAICYIAICVLLWVRGDCNMRNSSLLDHSRPFFNLTVYCFQEKQYIVV